MGNSVRLSSIGDREVIDLTVFLPGVLFSHVVVSVRSLPASGDIANGRGHGRGRGWTCAPVPAQAQTHAGSMGHESGRGGTPGCQPRRLHPAANVHSRIRHKGTEAAGAFECAPRGCASRLRCRPRALHQASPAAGNRAGRFHRSACRDARTSRSAIGSAGNAPQPPVLLRQRGGPAPASTATGHLHLKLFCVGPGRRGELLIPVAQSLASGPGPGEHRLPHSGFQRRQCSLWH